MAKAKPKRKRRAKQAALYETRADAVPEIDRAADSYVTARDERMRFNKDECQAQEKLLELMHKHGLTTYEYDGRVVSIVGAEKIKVKKQKVEPDAEPAE